MSFWDDLVNDVQHSPAADQYRSIRDYPGTPLGYVYSQLDRVKRRLGDMVSNPVDHLARIGGQVNDDPDAFGQQLSGVFTPAHMAGATVWHGSPKAFTRFDPTKIGTGEGAQAYSYGHYTAGAPAVGEEYARNLSNRDVTNQNRLNAHANAQRLAALAGDPKYAADDIRYALSADPDHPQKRLLTDTLAHLDSGTWKNPLDTSGYLYKIDLPDEHIARMLDWDKPLSEQHPDVQAALAKTSIRYRPGSDVYSPGDTGAEIYNNLARRHDLAYDGATDSGGAGALTSAMLRDAGIPGVRYLDGNSRGAGAGTSNYVVFPGNEHMLTIQERNGQPVEQPGALTQSIQGGDQ